MNTRTRSPLYSLLVAALGTRGATVANGLTAREVTSPVPLCFASYVECHVQYVDIACHMSITRAGGGLLRNMAFVFVFIFAWEKYTSS